jgi:hypothetical protein
VSVDEVLYRRPQNWSKVTLVWLCLMIHFFIILFAVRDFMCLFSSLVRPERRDEHVYIYLYP